MSWLDDVGSWIGDLFGGDDGGSTGGDYGGYSGGGYGEGYVAGEGFTGSGMDDYVDLASSLAGSTGSDFSIASAPDAQAAQANTFGDWGKPMLQNQSDISAFNAPASTSGYATSLGRTAAKSLASESFLQRLMKGDDKTVMTALNAVGLLGSLMNRGQGQMSVSQLKAQNTSPFNSWTPQQQNDFNKYFYAPPKVYVPPKYAHGGLACLADGGFVGYVQGDQGGQSDSFTAQLSPGEYVFDADSVAALGDGNNAAGAQMLDQLREKLRTQKRSGDPGQIPPPAKAPLDYLGGQ